MKNVKKLILLVLFTLFSANMVIGKAFAQNPTPAAGTKRPQIKERVQTLKGKSVHMVDTKVESISGTTLTISKDGKTYNVTTDSTTRFRRHFWGKSALSEISVGDNVNVWGKWADEAQSTITAKMVRDTSIMKRFGVFLGDVKSKGTDSFVLASNNRGDQTVYFDTKTKFVNRRGAAITANDVKEGDKVKVRGLWDKTLSQITQVTNVKDFARPLKPTKAATP